MELKPGYKLTDAGVIPEDWDVKPLKALLARSRLGGNYANQETETSYPLMKMGNLDRGFFDVSKVEYVKADTVPDEVDRLRYGDLLFNTRNTLDLVGKVAIWADELPVACYNSNLLRLEFDPELVPSPWYANAALNSHASVVRLRGLATGTTSVAAIYGRDLWKFQFVVPPPAEQRAIAGALSDVDALIGALDQLLAKKRDLKQAAMQQLLTGHQRLPGFAPANPRFQQTDVGLIPEDWQLKRLGDVASVRAGGTPSRTVAAYWNGGVPWITTSQVDFNVITQAEQFISEDGLKNSAAKLLPPGTLLMALYGQGKTRGKVATLGVPAATNQACAAISLSADVSHDFVFRYLVSQYDFIRNLSNTGNQENLNGVIVKSIPLPLPPTVAEQTAIGEVLSDMDAELAALAQKRDKTRLLKQGMMQELLTGRTRLVES